MSLMGPQDDLVHARIASMAREGKAFVGAAGNGGPHAPAGYPAAYGGGPWDFKGLMLAQLLSKDELKTRSPVYRHGLMRAPSTCASARSWVSSVKLEPLQPAPVLPAARVEPTPTVPGGWHRVPGLRHRRTDGGPQCSERQDDAHHPSGQVRAGCTRGPGATAARRMNPRLPEMRAAPICIAADRKFFRRQHVICRTRGEAGA